MRSKLVICRKQHHLLNLFVPTPNPITHPSTHINTHTEHMHENVALVFKIIEKRNCSKKCDFRRDLKANEAEECLTLEGSLLQALRSYKERGRKYLNGIISTLLLHRPEWLFAVTICQYFRAKASKAKVALSRSHSWEISAVIALFIGLVGHWERMVRHFRVYSVFVSRFFTTVSKEWSVTLASTVSLIQDFSLQCLKNGLSP